MATSVYKQRLWLQPFQGEYVISLDTEVTLVTFGQLLQKQLNTQQHDLNREIWSFIATSVYYQNIWFLHFQSKSTLVWAHVDICCRNNMI